MNKHLTTAEWLALSAMKERGRKRLNLMSKYQRVKFKIYEYNCNSITLIVNLGYSEPLGTGSLYSFYWGFIIRGFIFSKGIHYENAEKFSINLKLFFIVENSGAFMS